MQKAFKRQELKFPDSIKKNPVLKCCMLACWPVRCIILWWSGCGELEFDLALHLEIENKPGIIINRFTIPVREGEQHQPDPRHLWASWLMFSYQNPDYTHLVPSVPSNNTYVQQTFLSAQRTRVAIYHLWWTHQGLRVITSADYSFLRDGKVMLWSLVPISFCWHEVHGYNLDNHEG